MRLSKPKTVNWRSRRSRAQSHPNGYPAADCYAATRRIKADPALRSIPIIAVTSYALSGEGQKARVAGCDDYVPKPFSPRQLLSKIRQYLQ
jgi:two-component system cell cycle response regulator DivK